jgi:hypothetical protein
MLASRLATALLLLVPLLASAGERGGGGVDIDVIVPVPPYEHHRTWFFARDPERVPNTVTINLAPYVCDPHSRQFRQREDFVHHLQGQHESPPSALREHLLVRDGVVHFVGK